MVTAMASNWAPHPALWSSGGSRGHPTEPSQTLGPRDRSPLGPHFLPPSPFPSAPTSALPAAPSGPSQPLHLSRRHPRAPIALTPCNFLPRVYHHRIDYVSYAFILGYQLSSHTPATHTLHTDRTPQGRGFCIP